MSIDEAELRTANRAKVFVALDYLAIGLNSFVLQQLQQRYGDAWQDNIYRLSGHAPDLTDPYVLLATVENRWNSTFRSCFEPIPRSVIKELRDVRNATSHSGSFSDEAVSNSISSIIRLLDRIPQSEISSRMVDKIREAKDQPLQEVEEHQNSFETLLIAAPSDVRLIKDNKLEDKQVLVEVKQHSGSDLDTIPAQNEPIVTYNFSRLCFKSSQIEPLRDDQAFQVITPVGTFQMTKAEFRKSFPKVILSKSYSENGIYHYPSVPKSALIYKLPE